MAYSEHVIDHFENPRNVGSMDVSDVNVGTGMVGSPAIGDVMRVQIRVNAHGVIEDAKFKTYGCVSAIAVSSLVTEWLIGKTAEEAKTIKSSDLSDALALPTAKIHCAVQGENAIAAALQDLASKQL